MRFRKPPPEVPCPIASNAGLKFTDPFDGVVIDRGTLFAPFGYTERALGANPNKIINIAEAMRPTIARTKLIEVLTLPEYGEDIEALTRVIAYTDVRIPQAILDASQHNIERNREILRTNCNMKHQARLRGGTPEELGMQKIHETVTGLYVAVIPLQEARLLAEFQVWQPTPQLAQAS